MTPASQVLEVWGELACFTRPELKVERFSYPCITPSAARGIFDAIYAKPAEFRWQISKVELLRPPAYIALRRNEVKEKVNLDAVARWMAGKSQPEPIWADGDRDLLGSDEKGRTQRQTMALRDVHYRLWASINTWPGQEARLPALEAQFRRRAEGGKCFYQPYLGCREFPAYFRLVQPSEQAEPTPPPVDVDLDIGLMLYDVFDLSRAGSREDSPAISLFRAAVRRGVLAVPHYASPHVLKAPGRAG
jgi:CRISPR-associated protein Cas5d